MKMLVMALVGVLLAGSGAAAQDTGLVPRSSSPTGFRIENSALQADAAGPVTGVGRGGSGASAGSVSSAGGMQSSAAGAVQIQGNTNVNASGRNVDSTVVGAQNRGCTHVGGIGGNCR